jgi:hypothetical protein
MDFYPPPQDDVLASTFAMQILLSSKEGALQKEKARRGIGKE